MDPKWAFVLRILGTGAFVGNGVLLAVLATTGHSLTAHDLELAGMTGLQGALAYAGIGASIPQIEPKIGNKAVTK